MNLRDIVAVLIALLVNEACDVSPWIARKLVRWSAHLRYTDARRALLRADELVAVIDERPGKLFKLCTALGFTVTAGTVWIRRTFAARAGSVADHIAQARQAMRGDLTPYLTSSENLRGQWRRHWAHLARELTIGAVTTTLLGYLSGLATRVGVLALLIAAAALWTVVIAWVGWRVTVWHSERFVLTDHRLMMITGLFRRRVTDLPLSAVRQIVWTQTLTERILSCGTFELKSSDLKLTDPSKPTLLPWVKHLPNPRQVYLNAVTEFYALDDEGAEDNHEPHFSST